MFFELNIVSDTTIYMLTWTNQVILKNIANIMVGGKGSLQLKVSLNLKMLLEVKVTTEITECFNEVILVCIKIIAQ